MTLSFKMIIKVIELMSPKYCDECLSNPTQKSFDLFGGGNTNVCFDCFYKEFIYVSELHIYIHKNDCFIKDVYGCCHQQLNSKYGLTINNKGINIS